MLTTPANNRGQPVAASTDRPEYLVKSDETGAEAAHEPGALEKRAFAQ